MDPVLEDALKMADPVIMKIINQCIEQTRSDRPMIVASYSSVGTSLASKIRNTQGDTAR
jgi:hypothetical protein